MKKQILKDKKKGIFYRKTEINKLNQKIMSRIKEKNFLFGLEKKGKNKVLSFHNTCIKNRCFISTRKNCIHNKFRLSRIAFRTIASNCLIIGVKKAIF